MYKEPITENGFKNLEKKFNHFKYVMRPKIIFDIKKAREFGDLKENAEYHAAKEELFFIDKKIKNLENQILNSEIILIKSLNNEEGIVTFGSTVTIKNLLTLSIINYKIVGDYESNLKKNCISIKSPLAKKLIMKKKGDLIILDTHNQTLEYEIIDVKYI